MFVCVQFLRFYIKSLFHNKRVILQSLKTYYIIIQILISFLLKQKTVVYKILKNYVINYLSFL